MSILSLVGTLPDPSHLEDDPTPPASQPGLLVLSSDTTLHCHPDRAVFRHFTQFDPKSSQRYFVMLNNGTKLPVLGIGAILVNSHHIEDVLYVPSLPTAILSLYRLARSTGLKIEYNQFGTKLRRDSFSLLTRGGASMILSHDQPTTEPDEDLNLNPLDLVASLKDHWVLSTSAADHYSPTTHYKGQAVTVKGINLGPVSHDPSSLVNVISVTRLAHNGFRVVFNHGSARVFDHKDTLLLRAECRNGLYTFERAKPTRPFKLSLLMMGKTAMNGGDDVVKREEPKKPEINWVGPVYENEEKPEEANLLLQNKNHRQYPEEANGEETRIELYPGISLTVQPMSSDVIYPRTLPPEAKPTIEPEVIEELKQEVVEEDEGGEEEEEARREVKMVGTICRLYTRSSIYNWTLTFNTEVHATDQEAMFADYHQFDSDRRILVRIEPSGIFLKAHGMGTVRFSEHFSLKCVLHVPRLKCSLVSLTRLYRTKLDHLVRGEVLTIYRVDSGERVYRDQASGDGVWTLTWRG